MNTPIPKHTIECAWTVCLLRGKDRAVSAVVVQQLPDVHIYRKGYQADLNVPEDAAKFYDDVWNELKIGRHVMGLALEGICTFTPAAV